MTEVQARSGASRGRGSGRGGRGGFSVRGGGRAGNRSSATNGDTKHDVESGMPTLDDEGEVGSLKKQYGSKIGLIKEMFPDWSDVDILFALQETGGDESLAATRIAEGSISQWGEISKQKKDRAKPKTKSDTFTTTTGDSASAPANRTARGGRTGTEGTRGGRGRATERGGRGGRSKSSHATTNGTRTKENNALSVPTEESSEWDNEKPADDTTAWGESGGSAWETPAASEPAPSAPVTATTQPTAPAAPASSGSQKTWASMLRQSTAPKPAPKPKQPPAPKPVEPIIAPLPPADPAEPEPEPAPVEEKEPEPVAPVAPIPEPVPVAVPNVIVPEIALPPSKDKLTETNLEQVADESHPPVTETARSEATDSYDPRVANPSATPLSASEHLHKAPRAPASGFATTAIKATERTSTRTPSFQRRILDQEEAVRMPGNRDQVDRTAVQFGAFTLNGPIDDDIDGDREEPETRAQPPDDSPVALPRASLPPSQPAPVPEAFPAQKPAAVSTASALPPPTGPAAAVPTGAPAQPSVAPTASQPPAQPSQQFGRFGQPAQDPASFSAKPFDSYGQPQPAASATQSQFDGGFQNQQQGSQPQGQQQPGGAFSSAPAEYQSYYTADQQNRNPYNYYAQNFGQQQGSQGQQDAASTQRAFSGYNNAPQTDNLSQYPQSGAQAAQSRFGTGSATADAQTSGTNTPNPTGAQGQQQAGQNSQGQSHGQQQQQQQQQQQHDYPYNHPYYTSPYYAAYMTNYQGGYNQNAYGAPYGKGGMGFGQPNQYGMTPQGPHGYGSSPSGGFGQSSLHRGDSGAGGLGDYGRATSAQSGGQQGLGGSGFGGMHDSFARGASSYQSQGQSYNVPTSQPGAVPGGSDDLKPFGETKGAAGPSPSLGAAARPGSAANTGPSQGGLPPPQSSQQGLGGMGGYGGYPSHMQGHGLHGNQSNTGGYGMSGSSAQGHQNSYGGYGGQGFGGGYYGNQQPRGWGNNYGH